MSKRYILLFVTLLISLLLVFCNNTNAQNQVDPKLLQSLLELLKAQVQSTDNIRTRAVPAQPNQYILDNAFVGDKPIMMYWREGDKGYVGVVSFKVKRETGRTFGFITLRKFQIVNANDGSLGKETINPLVTTDFQTAYKVYGEDLFKYAKKFIVMDWVGEDKGKQTRIVMAKIDKDYPILFKEKTIDESTENGYIYLFPEVSNRLRQVPVEISFRTEVAPLKILSVNVTSTEIQNIYPPRFEVIFKVKTNIDAGIVTLFIGDYSTSSYVIGKEHNLKYIGKPKENIKFTIKANKIVTDPQTYEVSYSGTYIVPEAFDITSKQFLIRVSTNIPVSKAELICKGVEPSLIVPGKITDFSSIMFELKESDMVNLFYCNINNLYLKLVDKNNVDHLTPLLPAIK